MGRCLSCEGACIAGGRLGDSAEDRNAAIADSDGEAKEFLLLHGGEGTVFTERSEHDEPVNTGIEQHVEMAFGPRIVDLFVSFEGGGHCGENTGPGWLHC